MKHLRAILTVLAATLFCSLLVRAQDAPLKVLFPNLPLKVFLDDSAEIDFAYRATEAETISVYANSLSTNDETVDSVLELYNAAGNLLISNDDRGLGNLNPAIEDFRLPAAGEYVIRLSIFPNKPSGGVELLVINADGVRPTDEAVDNACDEATIAIGDSLTATVSRGTPTVFIFCGEQGQIVTLSAIATNPTTPVQDLIMTLKDENGTVLAQNDDIDRNGGNWDSMIPNFTLPADGLYTIEVETGANRAGSFILTILEG